MMHKDDEKKRGERKDEWMKGRVWEMNEGKDGGGKGEERSRKGKAVRAPGTVFRCSRVL